MGLIADLESVQLCPRSSLELLELVSVWSSWLLVYLSFSWLILLFRGKGGADRPQTGKGGAAVDPHCHTSSLVAPGATGCLRPSPRVEVGSCEAQPLACSQLCFSLFQALGVGSLSFPPQRTLLELTHTHMHMYHESSYV